MMRKQMLFVVLLALVTGITAVSSANAQVSVGGTSAGVLFSAGIEEAGYAGQILITEDTGRNLSVGGNMVVSPYWDEGFFVQINASRGDKETTSRNLEVMYATSATPTERQWKRAEFRDDIGWFIHIDPSQYVNSRVFSTPLKICFVIKDGVKRSVRFIIKFTYGYDDLRRTDILWIRPMNREPEAMAPEVAAQPAQPVADPVAINENLARMQEAIKALDANDQKLTEAINANGRRDDEQDARLERLEQWATATSVASQQTAVTPALSQPAVQQTYCWILTGLPVASYLLEMIENGKLRYWWFGAGSSTIEFLDAKGRPEIRVRVNGGAWKTLTLTGPCVVNFNTLQEVY